MLRWRGESQKWDLLSRWRGTLLTCVSHFSVDSVATLCMKGRSYPHCYGIRSVMTELFSIVANEVRKWRPFTFFAIMSPLSRHSEMFESFFLPNWCPFSNTVDGIAPNILSYGSRYLTRHFAWRGITILLNAALLLRTSRLLPLLEHVDPIVRTLHSLGMYCSFAARVCWFGHVRIGIKNKNISVDTW